MAAYYNENDSYAAQWLRNLIKAGLIADGFVDERSIRDVQPCDIWGFDQYHFFAGIGIWSAALRAAGVPDDFPVWTGSAPCQPFSGAGERRGFDDERHLWPEWRRLIAELRPSVVLGEQVGGGDGFAWLDLVQVDLEDLDYACGAIVAPAAGFGAPHGRHRIWFVAYAAEPGWRQSRRTGGSGADRHPPELGRFCATGELGDADVGGRPPGFATAAADGYRRAAVSASPGNAGVLVDAESEQARISRCARERRATAGFWAECDWIPCRGGKWRPVEPGTFPLVDGCSRRVEQLRAYGNAVVLPAATEFVKAALGAIGDLDAL
jgi:DNA (cytosine-5)-methyltransferase 1